MVLDATPPRPGDFTARAGQVVRRVPLPPSRQTPMCGNGAECARPPSPGPPDDEGDVMRDLPVRADPEQLQRRAEDLLRATERGDPRRWPGSARCPASRPSLRAAGGGAGARFHRLAAAPVRGGPPLAAGAADLLYAAAAGDVAGRLTPETSEADRVAALRTAAERGRLEVIDQLITASAPVDGVDRDGSTALHAAAYSGRPEQRATAARPWRRSRAARHQVRQHATRLVPAPAAGDGLRARPRRGRGDPAIGHAGAALRLRVRPVPGRDSP